MGKNQGGKCRCGGCGALFSALRAFDMHRTGKYEYFDDRRAFHPSTRRCLSVDEMRAKGMRQTSQNAWNTGREFPGCEKIAS